MKRYRPLAYQFDHRPLHLQQEIKEEWEPHVKEVWHHNQRVIRESLIHDYGATDFEAKAARFTFHGSIPLSIIAFHNKALLQIRNSYVMGAFYPSLTASCALGEWILNHLLLGLRHEFRSSPEYKKVHRKDSFSDWQLAIAVLEAWQVLRPKVATAFRGLREVRNRSLHFQPGTIEDSEERAVEAIDLIVQIVDGQFGAFGDHPWFCSVPGVTFIKKAFETDPFVKMAYLPNCELVGPEHELQPRPGSRRFIVYDPTEYEEREISDEKFLKLYQRASELRAGRCDT